MTNDYDQFFTNDSQDGDSNTTSSFNSEPSSSNNIADLGSSFANYLNQNQGLGVKQALIMLLQFTQASIPDGGTIDLKGDTDRNDIKIIIRLLKSLNDDDNNETKKPDLFSVDIEQNRDQMNIIDLLTRSPLACHERLNAHTDEITKRIKSDTDVFKKTYYQLITVQKLLPEKSIEQWKSTGDFQILRSKSIDAGTHNPIQKIETTVRNARITIGRIFVSSDENENNDAHDEVAFDALKIILGKIFALVNTLINKMHTIIENNSNDERFQDYKYLKDLNINDEEKLNRTHIKKLNTLIKKCKLDMTISTEFPNLSIFNNGLEIVGLEIDKLRNQYCTVILHQGESLMKP